MAARLASIIALGSPQARAILDEIPRHLIAECAEHEVDRALKECAIRPHAKRPWDTGVSCWKLPWRRDPRFQLRDDNLRVTIDVRSDLHRRRATVAPVMGIKCGGGIMPRDANRLPCKALEPEDNADLLRER
jgi:hypothetical protein